MNARSDLSPVTLVLGAALVVASCSAPREKGVRDTHADTTTDTLSTTIAMRRALSADLRFADSVFAVLEDTITAEFGADVATRLRDVRERFIEFRKMQCERLGAVFKDGTYAAVAELECLVYLAHSRRVFLEDHYGFIDRIRALKQRHAQLPPARVAPR